jgi:uncharacterized protein
MSEFAPQVIRRSLITPNVEGQCDCACGVTSPTPNSTSTVSAIGPMHRHPKLRSIPLCDRYRAAFVPSFSEVAVLNQDAWLLLSFLESSQPIASLPAEWQAQCGDTLGHTLDDLAALRFLANGWGQFCMSKADTLIAWLHVINGCNLRCSYCYLDPTSKDMSPQVGRQAVEAVFRSALAHDFPAVKLKYAGGEPILRFPLVVDLHRHATDLAEQHGLELDGVVLSNGVGIGPQMIEAMQSLGLRLAISLDGLGPYHDCQRHFADGRGSFEAVARTIDRALSAGLVPDISITVSGRNADGLPELIAWVLERDLPFSLNFYRENDQSASQTDLRLEEEHIIEGMLAAYKVIEEKMPQRCLLASLADRANLAAPHLRTCSVGHSYLVIDHRGRVAKCQMDMANTVTTIQDSDPLARVRESSEGIRNLPVDDKAECRDCQWRYWCAGGCPLQAYRATGRYDAKSPHCAIYRTLYPEVIRLEGLRLLKYADEP